ncbi:MAG: hypothetical protein ACE5JQ_11340 [Candidatus Methylomirabilales bacterium]
MDQMEQALSGLRELIDHYGKEIRAVSEEVFNGGRETSPEEFQGKVTEIQERTHREAAERYDLLVGVGAELEQEYLSRINLTKEMLGRAAVLKEVINATVKPVMVSP